MVWLLRKSRFLELSLWSLIFDSQVVGRCVRVKSYKHWTIFLSKIIVHLVNDRGKKIAVPKELNQQERGHQSQLRDIDRRYWADKAQLEQHSQQRRAEKCQQYRQTVHDILHNQEVTQRGLYHEAEQAEHVRHQAEVQENLERV